MRRRLGAWAMGLVVLALALTGCATLPPPLAAELRADPAQGPDPYRLRTPPPVVPVAAPDAAHLARAPDPGQLVSGLVLVWSNPGATGLFVGLFGEPFMPWTHIGLIAVEPDGVFVYDTNANLSLTDQGPATGHEGRGVQRIPYERYVDSGQIFGLYAPPPEVDTDRLLHYVREQYARRTPFDARFDADDPSALYCSELVAHAWVAAGAPPVRPVPARDHRSYNLVRQLLGIPDTGFYLPDQFIDPQRQRALWSRTHSPARIEALFAARRELALRLAPDAPLGRLIRWDDAALSLSAALHLREAPQRFVDAALAGTPVAETPAQVRVRVHALADAFFGPLPQPAGRP